MRMRRADLMRYGDAVINDVWLAGIARVDPPEQRGVCRAGLRWELGARGHSITAVLLGGEAILIRDKIIFN